MVIETGIAAIFITVLLSIIAISFGYGMLTNKVSSNSSEIKEMKMQDKVIEKKLDDLRMLVQTIVTKLNKQ